MFSMRLFKQSSRWEDVLMLNRQNKYRVSIKSFPDYKHLLQENYMEYKLFFFSKCNSRSFFYNTLVHLKKICLYST